ncbi:MAG TPA: DUF1128 family protein [Bacillota bacterium]|nr:DUF1128 family protein [Bacillota bacterium]
MNLETPSEENMQHLLNKLADIMSVANQSLFDIKHYDISKYDYLKQLHDIVVQKQKLTMSETEAFIDELRSIRKQ